MTGGAAGGSNESSEDGAEGDIDGSLDDGDEESSDGSLDSGDEENPDGSLYGSSSSGNRGRIHELAARAKNKVNNAYENRFDEETRKKHARVISGVGRGMKNLKDSAVKPFWDTSRDDEYNKERWKRRGINALKGAGKAAAGVTLGTAAAAVQAGISITDGKYNPMEGIGTFTAGYAGGSSLASRVGGNIANTFKEGYYDSEEGRQELIEKKQKEFRYSDDIDKKYMDDWGDRTKANEMKNLASDYLIPYGITDTKKQKSILKLANQIAGGDETKMKAAVERARRTSGFIEQLETQGQKGIVGDPDKQEKYIKSIIKSENLDATKDAKRIKQIEDNYKAAFKSAAQWYQVNKS